MEIHEKQIGLEVGLIRVVGNPAGTRAVHCKKPERQKSNKLTFHRESLDSSGVDNIGDTSRIESANPKSFDLCNSRFQHHLAR